MEEKELEFRKKLEEIITLGKKQNGSLTEGQLEEALEDMSLSKEQTEAIVEYLKTNKIGVGEPVNLDEFMSTEEKEYLESYLEEISMLETIPKSKLAEVTMKAITGEKDAILRIINHYLPQVPDIARLYVGQGVLLEDLIGEGNVALTIMAGMLFEAETAEEADQMILQSILEAMEAAVIENGESEKEEDQIVSEINKIAEQAEELAQLLGRKVSISEVSKEMGIAIEQIQETIKIAGAKIDSIQPEDDTR